MNTSVFNIRLFSTGFFAGQLVSTAFAAGGVIPSMFSVGINLGSTALFAYLTYKAYKAGI